MTYHVPLTASFTSFLAGLNDFSFTVSFCFADLWLTSERWPFFAYWKNSDGQIVEDVIIQGLPLFHSITISNLIWANSGPTLFQVFRYLCKLLPVRHSVCQTQKSALIGISKTAHVQKPLPLTALPFHVTAKRFHLPSCALILRCAASSFFSPFLPVPAVCATARSMNQAIISCQCWPDAAVERFFAKEFLRLSKLLFRATCAHHNHSWLTWPFRSTFFHFAIIFRGAGLIIAWHQLKAFD